MQRESKRENRRARRGQLTSAYRAYPLGAVLLASREQIQRVLLSSFPVSHLERQSGRYTAASATAARIAATRRVADATSGATIAEAGRFHHVDALHGDPSAFLATLQQTVIRDQHFAGTDFESSNPRIIVI